MEAAGLPQLQPPSPGTLTNPRAQELRNMCPHTEPPATNSQGLEFSSLAFMLYNAWSWAKS